MFHLPRDAGQNSGQRRVAAILTVAVSLGCFGVSKVLAQGFMRSPSLNIESRVPTISPNIAPRINPNIVKGASGIKGIKTFLGAKGFNAAHIAGVGNAAGAGKTSAAVGINGHGHIAGVGRGAFRGNSSGTSTVAGQSNSVSVKSVTAGSGGTAGTAGAGRTTTTSNSSTNTTSTTPAGVRTSSTTSTAPAGGPTTTGARTTPTVTTANTTPTVTPTVTPTATTPMVTTATVTPTVTPTAPAVAPPTPPRVAMVLPTLPYARYSPILYPACTYANRASSGECQDNPIASAKLSDGGGAGSFQGPPPQSQIGRPRGNRNNPQAGAAVRYVSNEVIAEIDSSVSDAQADQFARRHRLTRIGSQEFPLIGSTMSLFRINDRRSVETVNRELSADAGVRSVQPNFRYVLQDQVTAPAKLEGDPAQYAIAKLRLPEAHALSHGNNVTVAVIDSGIDVAHPELADAIAGSFDALGSKEGPHVHGTGIAGAIVSHARLMGSAPSAKILAIRAFGVSQSGAESTSFVILKGLNYAASNGVQVINMSFAGPQDPLVERGVAAAAAKGIVMVAASGNAGPKSPPLYPAASANVIAVSATDAYDRLFPASNRGSHIVVAAPGVDIFLPAPDGKYQMTSGTSFSAAYISGLAALMIERNPALKPDEIRGLLMKTARDLGTPGRDDLFGAGEADAYTAVSAVQGAGAPVAGTPPAAVQPGEAAMNKAAAASDSMPSMASDKPALQ